MIRLPRMGERVSKCVLLSVLVRVENLGRLRGKNSIINRAQSFAQTYFFSEWTGLSGLQGEMGSILKHNTRIFD